MKKALLLGLLVVLIVSGSAYGHIPVVSTYDKCRVRIPAPMEQSIAIYASFEKSGDVDKAYFRLGTDDFDPSITMPGEGGADVPLVVSDPAGVPGRRLHVGSLIPACETYINILPSVAVVGPVQTSLPAYDGSFSLPGSVDIGSGEGVTVINNSVQGPVWYEHYTFKSYYDQNNADIIVTRPGTYKIYVWDPMGNKGDYVLEVGYVENFGVEEILQSMFWINHLVNDGEISCNTCKDQLEELDGPNPSPMEVIEIFSNIM